MITSIPVNTQIVMGTIFCILVTASFITRQLQNKNPDKDFTELKQRVNSWWFMAGLIMLVLAISTSIAILFFAILSFFALKEFLAIIGTRASDRTIILWAYLAIPIQYYLVYIGWYGLFIIFIPVYVFLFLPMRMVLIGETKAFVKSAAELHWAVMLTVYCLSHLAYLIALPELNTKSGAIGLVLYLLFMTQFNDVCQYIWGKKFGKHKIVPRVSPNKTWEGLVGAVITIMLISGILAPFLTPLDFKMGLVAGLLISLAGFIGDIVISSVKRDLEIKDTGSLIPGHGGLLDRLDSLTYTAPLFFHFIYYLKF